MKDRFAVGDKVTLTESMRKAATEPYRYRLGTVTRIGSWNVYDVKWNGLPHPIGMRGDEITPAGQEETK